MYILQQSITIWFLYYFNLTYIFHLKREFALPFNLYQLHCDLEEKDIRMSLERSGGLQYRRS